MAEKQRAREGWPSIKLTGHQTLWVVSLFLLMGACYVRNIFNPPVARRCKTLNLEMSKEVVKKHMSAFPLTEEFKPGYGWIFWFGDTSASIAPPSYAHFTEDGKLEDFSCGEGYGMRRHEPILKN